MFDFVEELFPPKPTFSEFNIPDQAGRVFIVTGGASGLGFEVAKALYHLNGRVYIAGRSEDSAVKAMEQIKTSSPRPEQIVSSGRGELAFLKLDLADLSTIKTSAMEFLSKEKRLDVVFHNAGCMAVPLTQKTAQGFDMVFGTNVLGPFLFQSFLTPLCLSTCSQPGILKASTRVIFVSSLAHRASPVPDGVNWADLNLEEYHGLEGSTLRYGQSKACVAMFAHEMARRYAEQGLVCLSLHPGNLRTNVYRHAPSLWNKVFQWVRYEPYFGGLTELYAGLTEEVDGTCLEDGGWNGGYVHPFGRLGPCNDHVFEGLKNGSGERLWRVCENLCREYL